VFCLDARRAAQHCDQKCGADNDDSLGGGCIDYYCRHVGVDSWFQKDGDYFIACERVWNFVLPCLGVRMMPNKIAALNWRWRSQFGRRGFQFGFGCIGCSLSAPVSELKRSAEYAP
jgi:hypothetical protein